MVSVPLHYWWEHCCSCGLRSLSLSISFSSFPSHSLFLILFLSVSLSLSLSLILSHSIYLSLSFSLYLSLSLFFFSSIYLLLSFSNCFAVNIAQYRFIVPFLVGAEHTHDATAVYCGLLGRGGRRRGKKEREGVLIQVNGWGWREGLKEGMRCIQCAK